MKKTKAIIVLIMCLMFSNIYSQNTESKKYSADVPEYLLTPEFVETKTLGNLAFRDGLPSEETVKKIYDFLDVSRGVDVFLNGMPAASIYALLEGFKSTGMEPGDVGLFENLMDARSLFLTANSSTPYVFGELDIKNGPVIIH